jgi:ATP-dependent DNA ligase
MNNRTKIFPTLYGKEKNGKTKVWDICVENKGECSEVRYAYGYIDGKKVECVQIVENGKNIGRKNETTHYTQALMDAEAKWKGKKEKEGYNETAFESCATPKTKTECLFPMLAQEYKKYIKKVKFPCYIQPKLDGYRMIYNGATKKVTSRTGKEFVTIYKTELYKELLKFEVNLDGELYTHDPDFLFEDYGVLRKVKALTEKESAKLDLINYHVYDIIDPKASFDGRKETLMELFEKHGPLQKLTLVDTHQVGTEAEINKYHNTFINSGYEGSMVRNKDGMYVMKYRSYDLLKKKDFDDHEYKIVDYTSEKDVSKNGKEPSDGLIVWICEIGNGKEASRFSVRPKGNEEERRWLMHNAKDFIGKKLWTKHFGLTENGIPRFPTTARDTYKDYIRNAVD